MKARVVLAGTVTVFVIAGIVAGTRLHEAHVSGQQRAEAQRVARMLGSNDGQRSTACPAAPTVTCLTSDLPVRAAATRVATSMRAAAHRRPQVRCFAAASGRESSKGPARSCVIDVAFGAHRAFAWVNVTGTKPLATSGRDTVRSTIGVSTS